VNVFALDLGTSCGWAVSESGRITSGVQTFDLRRGESPGMRWLRFDRWLEDMLTPDHHIDLVVYEAVLGRFAKGQAQTFIASNFAGRIQGVCAARPVEHTDVPGSTLKRFITGKGNAKKAAMRRAALQRGWLARPDEQDDNEVDALCLLHYALAEIVPTTSAERR
jgi:crossover junction endodeoxyribonuclease RuvC